MSVIRTTYRQLAATWSHRAYGTRRTLSSLEIMPAAAASEAWVRHLEDYRARLSGTEIAGHDPGVLKAIFPGGVVVSAQAFDDVSALSDDEIKAKVNSDVIAVFPGSAPQTVSDARIRLLRDWAPVQLEGIEGTNAIPRVLVEVDPRTMETAIYLDVYYPAASNPVEPPPQYEPPPPPEPDPDPDPGGSTPQPAPGGTSGNEGSGEETDSDDGKKDPKPIIPEDPPVPSGESSAFTKPYCEQFPNSSHCQSGGFLPPGPWDWDDPDLPPWAQTLTLSLMGLTLDPARSRPVVFVSTDRGR